MLVLAGSPQLLQEQLSAGRVPPPHASQFFPCSVPGGACRLCGAAGCVTGLNSLFRRGWGGHTEDNSPRHPGHALSFCGSAVMKWIFVLMHAQISVSLYNKDF